MKPFTSRPKESVAALGEERLIAAIRRWLGSATPPTPFGIGDDCAVLRLASPKQLITVDPVVYDRHFDVNTRPADVGAKLLKRNISDIAAMGGRPRSAVISLLLDPRTRTVWLEQFYRGLAATAKRFNVAIVGGDIAQADGTLAASLTLVGEATVSRVLTRRGARAGDWIFVTGELGNSLRSGHHFRFTPRIAEGAWLVGQPVVRAMMDVSDGLAKDLRALTPERAVAALYPTAIPRRKGADLKSAISEGEDYELVFAVARNADRAKLMRAWQRRFPRVRLTCIGRFVRRREIPADTLDLEHYRGYEHLR